MHAAEVQKLISRDVAEDKFKQIFSLARSGIATYERVS